LEDGVALGIVMHGATDAADIEARLAVYEKVRRNRASAIQTLSNIGQDQIRLIGPQLAEFMSPEEIPGKIPVSVGRLVLNTCLPRNPSGYLSVHVRL
jgi:salicylate hydroxylase